ncbi:SGNH/GDSL hydrolase family protein [Polynucleobacter sp. 15G-AUS-farblos]|uniref:SGNH/GDSL hydrolase family protein n=1 Tax=Polynucleobacter sp. 15G-AUS-farblos TaxID=2689094 RepID=UPI001C0B50CA|nr:SGNH/GDSL hydrolase family protein [Polynucleobacter sp. 15G-AUS-farblos]MBU3584107.1 SGNH/GDSL hydrolase family protein [Polynucleobacter sp. 15G-AUS-farblos]
MTTGLILATLLFLAVGSELSMPFVSQGRLPLIERGFYNYSEKLGWVLKPNLDLRIVSRNSSEKPQNYFSTNAQGFRTTPPFHDNYSTGIVLGDSFAQGFYLKDNETIPWKLAELTNSNVINTGVGGYSTDQELITLQHTISPKVKWVVLLFFANDLLWNAEKSSWGLEKPRFEIHNGKVNFSKIYPPKITSYPSEKDDAIKNNSVFTELCCIFDGAAQWQAIKQKFKKYLQLTSNPLSLAHQIREDYKWVAPYSSQYSYIMPKEFYENPTKHKLEWDVAFQMIAEMNSISVANQSRFLVVYIPEIAQLLNNDGVSTKNLPQEYFLEQCKNLRLDCIDPTDLLSKNAMRVYVQDDGHLSPFGANILANKISEVIAKDAK